MSTINTPASSQPAAQASTVNDIETDTLQATVKAIAADPGLAAFRFRATNKWLAGNHNRSTVTGFHGARQEIAHKQAFHMDADEPAILAGNDDGANPVEHLLHALASCVTTSIVAHAAVRGIHIEALESEVEGDLDLRGFLGLDPDVPKGYTDIRIKFKVKADKRHLAQLRSLMEFSPVYNTLTGGVKVDLAIESS